MRAAGGRWRSPSSRSGTALAGDKLATPIIDRIVHHERLVEFTGTSRRTDAALMLAGARKAVWVEQIIDVG